MNTAYFGRVILVLVVLLPGVVFSASGTDAHSEPIPLEGQTFVHDPSTILKHDERYHLFSTGWGISTKSSLDRIHWTNGPAVFSVPPSWTTNAVQGFRGYIWAPDIIRISGQYYLYYSISTFGRQVSAIGLATNPTLDLGSPDYRWTDRGPVIQSTNGSPFNAIDPSVARTSDGNLWMVFGSFWKGIFLVQLDPKTGLRRATNSPIHRLAYRSSIEAACLMQRGEDYYLFVNWGRCCRGTNSTYEIRVGRSKQVTGPYLDRDQVDLVNEGGTRFLETTGRFIGPGHVGILTEGGTNWFSYHYYDAQSNGRSRLAIAPLYWTAEGWPVVQSLSTATGSQ
jgi:arabinan endo-1,5-alpha-L-arabinosidase